MGDIKGFLKVKRKVSEYRSVCERVQDYSEVNIMPTTKHSEEQASRCMDCGTPFCHWGCPIGNYIPEWNDLLFGGHWEKAYKILSATNNFPEITGRVCPASCESACVLGINDDPVTIRENELAIIEYAFNEGFIRSKIPKKCTKKKIAIIGSGPAGLSCADQLNKAGHKVIVFEKDDKVGGIMRYGIPDFKLEKWILDRRIRTLKTEGIEFVASTNIGVDYKFSKLKKEFDVVLLACGCRVARDLDIEGRNLDGIHFAMDYLIQSNKAVEKGLKPVSTINAKDRNVVVIGGGDTGSDCVGTANRQGAKCVIQIEIMPKLSVCRTDEYPWPKHPLILKTSSSHEEGIERKWSILTKKFIGRSFDMAQDESVQTPAAGQIQKILCVRVDSTMKEIKGSEFEIKADLVVLALGFMNPEINGLVSNLGIKLTERKTVWTDSNYATSVKKVFSCGDMRRGQSLIVWAISEGRRAAHCIDRYLMGKSNLPML